MTPEEMVAAALEVAESGMAVGELPIGAVVVMGDDIIGRGYATERTAGRRLTHADINAMNEADMLLGWDRRPYPLALAITLEPCVMCYGSAMMLGVSDIYYALESPSDGGAWISSVWVNHRDAPFLTAPRVHGGILRSAAKDQHRRYCASAPESGYKAWAQSLLALPDPVG
jgi:tRNA(adenine34) deaminase